MEEPDPDQHRDRNQGDPSSPGTRAAGDPGGRRPANSAPAEAAPPGATSQPGSRGAGRPGARTAGAQASLELTVGEQAAAAPPSTPAPGRLHPTDRAVFAEIIHEAAAQAAKDQVERMLGPAVGQVSALCVKVEEALAVVRQVGQDVATVMEDSADAAQENFDAAQKGFDEARAAADKRAAEEAQERKVQISRASEKVDDAAADLREAARMIGWRPWMMALSVAAVLLLLVTLLRPGWTMTSSQRRALRVGETVIRSYDAADTARRAEIRRVLRWRSPPPRQPQRPPRRR